MYKTFASAIVTPTDKPIVSALAYANDDTGDTPNPA